MQNQPNQQQQQQQQQNGALCFNIVQIVYNIYLMRNKKEEISDTMQTNCEQITWASLTK